MDLQLDDLIANYPDPLSENIQTLITAKKEFMDLASSVSEPPPRPGQSAKHQEFVGRYMLTTDRLLMMHRTGTGKTCAFIRVAEYYRKLREIGDEAGTFKRAIVLVKGPTLRREFKNQLVCRCTAGTYISDLVKNSQNETSRKSNLTTEIKKWYDILTYGKFTNRILGIVGKKKAEAVPALARPLTEEEIVREFSDCIFFVDEVHNFRIDPTTGDDANNVRRQYEVLHRVFHLIQRSKVILATATPMINDPREIGPIMDLINPPELQFPSDFDYSSATLEQVEPYFRGKLSFVRETDTGAIPTPQGVPLDAEYEIPHFSGETGDDNTRKGTKKIRSQTIVYPSTIRSVMDEQGNPIGQSVGYAKALEEGTANVYEAPREASYFVFPDGSYGNDAKAEKEKRPPTFGFNKYVQEIGPDNYRATPELLPWLQNLDLLDICSAIYATIVRVCRDEPGSCFIFTHRADIGAYLLGLCFEAQGFEKFNETQSIFQPKVPKQTGPFGSLPPVCGSPEELEDRQVKPNFQMKPRYAILTHETSTASPAKVDAIMETFNSYENRHGDYIKVMIGSPITRDGINLANVLQIHISSADWTPSGTYQAESRAIRATSHVALLDEEKERIREENLRRPESYRDPELATIQIKTYKHVAIPDWGAPSIGVKMYELQDRKSISIKRMERLMKQCTIDCQIHYQRNVRPTDVDGSAVCDYDKCHYTCVNPAPPGVDPSTYRLIDPRQQDVSTYDVYYSDKDIEMAISAISDLFTRYFSLSLSEIYNALIAIGIRRKFIDLALYRIVESKRIFYNRYGFLSYLQINGDKVFVTREYPDDMHQELIWYTENLIARETTSLYEYVANLQTDQQGIIIEEIPKLSPESSQFNEYIDQLNTDNKVRLLEDAVYKRVVEGDDAAYIEAIINKFQQMFFPLKEPVTELNQMAITLSKRGHGPGRKPGPTSKIKIKKITEADLQKIEEDNQNENDVYIHTLYTQATGQTAYNVTSKANKVEGRLRILKPIEGRGWRDMNEYELPVYSMILQQIINRRKERFEQHDVYGTILADGNFRIRSKLHENVELSEKDNRVKRKGKICGTWFKPELISVLWELRVPPPRTVQIETTDRDTIIAYLSQQKGEKTPEELEEYSDEQLQFYYRWYRSGATRTSICSILQQHLQSIGRLYVV